VTAPRSGPPPRPLPTPTSTPRQGAAGSPFTSDASGDAYIRRAGKGLILGFYAALRAIKM